MVRADVVRPRMCFAGPVRIDFHPSARPTLGVEWEFALVDRKSRDLVSGAEDVHVHDFEGAKGPEFNPLGGMQPDPFLPQARV